MSTPFHTTRRVEFHETDMAGIVHFSNFFRYMEMAEVEFLRARGLHVSWAVGDTRHGFPRVSASCDYLKPARFEDVLDVTVTVDQAACRIVRETTLVIEAGTRLSLDDILLHEGATRRRDDIVKVTGSKPH